MELNLNKKLYIDIYSPFNNNDKDFCEFLIENFYNTYVYTEDQNIDLNKLIQKIQKISLDITKYCGVVFEKDKKILDYLNSLQSLLDIYGKYNVLDAYYFLKNIYEELNLSSCGDLYCIFYSKTLKQYVTEEEVLYKIKIFSVELLKFLCGKPILTILKIFL